MKLDYDPLKDRRQLRALMKLVIFAQKSQVVSGMSMRRIGNQDYGIDIDHHEWAYLLDELHTAGLVDHYAYHGGDTQYVVLGQIHE